MSADIAARLRQLAQDHHDGRLDLGAYRSLRSPLLDSLVENILVASALDATQPRAVATGTVRTLPEPKPDSRLSARSLGAIAIMLAVAVVAAGGLLMLRGRPSGMASTTSPSRAPLRVIELVNPFMDRGEWSDARLATLNASLLELGGPQIAEVADDARFQRFVDELRSRLKEQQALSPAPLTANNSPLAALAVTVGIDLNSPDSALHITALPPPPPSDGASTAVMAPPSPRHVVTDGDARAIASGAVQPANSVGGPSAGTKVAPAPTISSAAAGQGSSAGGASSEGGGIAPAASGQTATHGGPAAMATQLSNTAAAVETHEGACRLDLIRSRRPLCHDVLPDGAEAPILALIPAGAFDMGSTASSEEQPVHHVTIRQPFAISVYEVSQGEFKQYCERAKRTCAPQPWAGDDYPVVNISWDDARAYADWLSATTHHRYSLPTEAQWEYAARAGRAGLFPSGDALSATDAQFSGATRQTSAARRGQTFNPNAFRLLHTVGNVREWVEDSWSQNFAGAPDDGSAVNSAQGALRVVRGGSYADGAARLRLSLRESLPLTTRDGTTGFRIARELP